MNGQVFLMDSENQKGYDQRISRRIFALSVLFAIWALIALGRAWYIAGPGRARFIAAGEKMARRRVVIPAVRGRILDANGVCLVWSERFYDLQSLTPEGDCLSDEELEELKKALPEIDDEGRILRRNLSPEELLRLETPLKSGIRARIVSRDERIAVAYPEIRQAAGELRFRDGCWRGASGWEAEFDAELSGSPGSLTVMLDRSRNWIPSSVRVQRQPVPGRDVRLKWSLDELIHSGKGEREDAK